MEVFKTTLTGYTALAQSVYLYSSLNKITCAKYPYIFSTSLFDYSEIKTYFHIN